MNISLGNEDKKIALLKELRKAKEIFLIGYILRIIPVFFIDSIGYILTSISWIRSYTKINKKIFLITGILLIITTAMYSYTQVIELARTTTMISPQISVGGEVNYTKALISIRNVVYSSAEALSSIRTIVLNIVFGLTLFVEALSFRELYKINEEIFKARVLVLLILLSIVVFISIPISLYIVGELYDYGNYINEKILEEKVSLEELQRISFGFVGIFMPLYIVNGVNFVIRLLAYIFAALAFRDLDRYLKNMEYLSTQEEL